MVPDLDIGVIGGGIAGLTLTTCLLALGAKVTLYECMSKVLNLQNDNFIRFIHPNIATWPNEEYGYPWTTLPFMNWRAGKAGDVNKELRSQWDAFRAPFEQRHQLEIKLKSRIDNKSFQCNGATESVEHFQHQDLIETVMLNADLRAAAETIKTGGSWSTLWPTNVTAQFQEFFKRIRPDTEVVVQDRNKFPDDSSAQILHKVLVSLLMAGLPKSEIDFWQGDLKKQPSQSGGKFHAEIAGRNEKFDAVIQRHGADSTFAQLMGLSKDSYKRLSVMRQVLIPHSNRSEANIGAG